jgi:hypothetical protein
MITILFYVNIVKFNAIVSKIYPRK